MNPVSAIVALVVVITLQALYFYPQLPTQMASHFDAIGQPNGWAPKWFFFLIYAGVVTLVAWLVWGVPNSIECRPDSQINLPHKDYWLAPERRTTTFAFIRQQLGWFSVANLVLMVCVFQLVISANLNPPARLPVVPIWALLGVYLLYTIGWLVRFYQRFRHPT